MKSSRSSAISRQLARSIILGALLSLAACTEYWAKPGGTAAEFDATKAACQAQAYSQFPPIPQQTMLTSGYTTPMQTTCTGGGYTVNCFTTGGQYVPPAYMTTDLNQSGRSSAVRACLFAAGWQPVKDKDEARAVTNSVSGAVSTEAVGEARVYCDRFFKSDHNVAMIAVFKTIMMRALHSGRARFKTRIDLALAVGR